MKKITIRLLAIVIMGSLAACGGGQPERADTVSKPRETADSSDRSLTQQQVEAALLTVQDLPTGWSTAEPGSGSVDIEPAECADLFDDPDRPSDDAVARADATFDAGNVEHGLVHEVVSYNSNAAGRLDEYVDLLEECPELRLVGADGTLSLIVTPLSFPSMGDKTVAIRLKTPPDDTWGAWVGDVILVAVGNSVISIMAGGSSSISADALESIVETAVSRLTQATRFFS